ncbi:MAG: AAA family ATPase [Blautia sp.]
MYYSQEQIDRANQTNMEDFLRSQGETLIRSGKEYRWKCHDSLTVRGNKWFRHSQSRGGYPVDFVMEFYGKSFPEAVQLLTGEAGAGKPDACPAPSPDFRLPLHNATNTKAIKYLTEERKIDRGIVDTFIAAGDIYEDTRHNVVFVGRDSGTQNAPGIPRYAHCRGTSDKFRQDMSGSDKACNFSYQGDSDQLFVFEAPIDLLSFLCLYPKDWMKRSYLSLGGVAGKALTHFLSERPDIRRIFLCLDNDNAGNDGCSRLSSELPESLTVLRLLPAMKDWNEVLQHREELPNRKYIAETITLKEPAAEPPVPMIRMSEVQEVAVEWLWEPYLPFGKLTILQGNPGEGKTYFAMQLAAACTNRRPLPNMEPLEPFNVIYQTAEDGLGDTVKPRLLEAGADLDRVMVIDDGDKPLTLSDKRLERAIRENHARLLIIDPVQAFLGADVDMNRANEVRPIFRKLGEIAQETGCAIILIGHLNKAAGSQSTYRGLGSIDITAVVRSLLFIGKVKNDPTTRVLIQEKSSLAPPGKSLAFSLGDGNGFQWIGEYDMTADELLAGVEHTETKAERAEKLILDLLADGKQMLSADIDKAAAQRGISARTVRTAKQSLGNKLISERSGTQWLLSLKTE